MKDIVSLHSSPETVAATPDVPIRQVVQKLLDASRHSCQVVAVELCCHLIDQTLKAQQDPTIEVWTFLEGNLRLPGMPTVEIGVDGEERQGVPQRQQEALRRLAHQPCREAGRLLRIVDAEVPAQGIGASLLHHP